MHSGYFGDILRCDEDVVAATARGKCISCQACGMSSCPVRSSTGQRIPSSLDKAGANIRFAGACVSTRRKTAITRRPPRGGERLSRPSPAMLAAVMRPGWQRSMNINDPPHSPGHANDSIRSLRDRENNFS